jgi:ubiquinone/menaquinone biosynthesis C-methylase UbiE
MFRPEARNDVERYVAEFLMRQRVVNQRVIDWAGCIKPRDKVFDACAGPEGSLLATKLKLADWIGGEYSINTARHLKQTGGNVFVGDAKAIPLKSASIDCVVYIFALNNVQGSKVALQDASRVLKSGGHVVISDPGVTRWVTDIYLGFLQNQGKLGQELSDLVGKIGKRRDEIREFLNKNPNFKNSEYQANAIQGLFGLGVVDIERLANEIYSDMAKKQNSVKFDEFSYKFRQVMNSWYWKNLLNSGMEAGLKVKKVGLLNVDQPVDHSDWKVGPITDIPNVQSGEEMQTYLLSVAYKAYLKTVATQGSQALSKQIISPTILLEK